MPLRWHLAGLAVVWMMIALLNTEQSTREETAAKASSTEELLVAMQENRRQLLELTEAPAADTPKPALQLYVPKRRSEAVPLFAVA